MHACVRPQSHNSLLVQKARPLVLAENRAQAEGVVPHVPIGMSGHIWVHFKKSSQSDEKLQWQRPRRRVRPCHLQINILLLVLNL